MAAALKIMPKTTDEVEVRLEAGTFKMACGASTSYAPRYDLVPSGALRRLAQRYALGAEEHGEENWREGVGDRDYILQRLNHVIAHALKLKDELKGFRPSSGDDHAAAIMWGGAFLCEAWEPLAPSPITRPSPAPPDN